MKEMKKTMKCLITVLMMVMAFAVTGMTAEAEELKKIDLKNYGTTNVDITIPDADYLTITQTGATSKSVTISWNALQGASGYLVYYGDRYIGKVAGKSCTIQLYGAEYEKYGYVYIYPYVTYQGEDYGSNYNYKYQMVYPAPKKVSDSAVTLWNPTKKDIGAGKYKAEISYARNSYYPDGYEVIIYNLSNKKIKTLKSTTFYAEFSIKSGKLKKCWNKGLKYEVKPYKTINGKKYYGDSTGKKVFIPQATITSLKSKTIKWKKVSGAKGYYIYLSTNYGKKFKKIKTVGKNTTSAYIKKLSSGSKYQVYVIPYGVKVGKKKYKGTYTISSYYTITYR